MPMFLARQIDDQQMVGFFFVENQENLFELVDECCDPNNVEVREIANGGIMWSDHAPAIPQDEIDDEEFHGPELKDATYTEEWLGALDEDDGYTPVIKLSESWVTRLFAERAAHRTSERTIHEPS